MCLRKEYAPIAQLDRALVSGTRFVGGSNPPGRVIKIQEWQGFGEFQSLAIFIIICLLGFVFIHLNMCYLTFQGRID